MFKLKCIEKNEKRLDTNDGDYLWRSPSIVHGALPELNCKRQCPKRHEVQTVLRTKTNQTQAN